MDDVGRFHRSPPAVGDDPPPLERRPLATSAVGDDVGKKKRLVEKTAWIALVQQKRRAIMKKYFGVTRFDLGAAQPSQNEPNNGQSDWNREHLDSDE